MRWKGVGSPARGRGRNKIPRTAKGVWDDPGAVRIHADWKAQQQLYSLLGFRDEAETESDSKSV